MHETLIIIYKDVHILVLKLYAIYRIFMGSKYLKYSFQILH